jgi:hypothetical protein
VSLVATRCDSLAGIAEESQRDGRVPHLAILSWRWFFVQMFSKRSPRRSEAFAVLIDSLYYEDRENLAYFSATGMEKFSLDPCSIPRYIHLLLPSKLSGIVYHIKTLVGLENGRCPTSGMSTRCFCLLKSFSFTESWADASGGRRA